MPPQSELRADERPVSPEDDSPESVSPRNGGYLSEMAAGGYDMDSIGPFHSSMIPWLLEHCGVGREARVVDIGAGQGHGLVPLHRAGWRDLVAVDRDAFNFDRFRREYGIEPVRANIETDVLSLETESVDAVLMMHLIEHLRDPTHALRECFRVLRPGGRLFVVTPDWRKQLKEFYRDPTHVQPYDKTSMGRLLRSHGFEAELHSWKAAFGLGRIQAYRWMPRLGMIGSDLLAVGRRSARAVAGEVA